ncbi:MAG: hypothetical protein GC154_13555 [bacterium]|nr:hypothetical protein [bacterium]
MKNHALWIAAILIGFAAVSPAWTQEQTDYHANAQLTCENQEFQSEAVFVTEATPSLDFLCRIEPNPKPPEDFTAEPTVLNWEVTSGAVEAQGARCVWTGMDPGKQVIRVKGELVYTPPSKGLLSYFKKPEPIRIPFETEKICIIPFYVPKIQNGRINGYVIGQFPDPAAPQHLKLISNEQTRKQVEENADVYTRPSLFYEINHETYFIKIFENYTLGDFDLDPRFLNLKYPRYIAIHPTLLRKIHLLEEQLKEDGHPVTKLKIFYGFRSPDYNLGRRNRDGDLTLKSPFSMHMYGRAVDFIIDEDDDLVIDDLNGDGRIDIGDANVIMHSVNRLDTRLRDEGNKLVGGAGPYPHHDYYERGEIVQTPYVHMDTRGYISLDGTLVRWIGKDAIGVAQMKHPYQPKAPIPQWPWKIPDPNAKPLPDSDPGE